MGQLYALACRSLLLTILKQKWSPQNGAYVCTGCVSDVCCGVCVQGDGRTYFIGHGGGGRAPPSCSGGRVWVGVRFFSIQDVGWIWLSTSLNFPIFMTFTAFVSVLGTATLFNNNSKIVNSTFCPLCQINQLWLFLVTGNWISLSHSFFHPFKSSWSSRKESFPSTRLGIIFSNPFIASPLLFCTLILSVALFVHPWVLFHGRFR